MEHVPLTSAHGGGAFDDEYHVDFKNNHHQEQAAIPPGTECRICLFADPSDDLIAPCRCSGSMKFVHRNCVDEFRATKLGRAFTHCPQCHFEYVVRIDDDTDEERRRRRRFKLFVARDTIAVFLAIQILIASLVCGIDC
jgi:E3 ubiquitin-protein ligase DOA10